MEGMGPLEELTFWTAETIMNSGEQEGKSGGGGSARKGCYREFRDDWASGNHPFVSEKILVR